MDVCTLEIISGTARWSRPPFTAKLSMTNQGFLGDHIIRDGSIKKLSVVRKLELNL